MNETRSDKKFVYTIGKTYVFFTPPSWLLGGTVTEIHDDHLVLKDCTYLEQVATDQTLIGGVALAQTAKQMTAVVQRAWPLPDGTILHTDGILIATPCFRDLTPIARQADANEIKKTK